MVRQAREMVCITASMAETHVFFFFLCVFFLFLVGCLIFFYMTPLTVSHNLVMSQSTTLALSLFLFLSLPPATLHAPRTRFDLSCPVIGRTAHIRLIAVGSNLGSKLQHQLCTVM